MMRRYVARFTPEVWINDYAVGVDPYESEQEWDCTDYLGLLRSDSTGVYAGRLLAVALLREIEVRGDAIDTCDVLRDDPAAPGWIRDWDGPFTIKVRREES